MTAQSWYSRSWRGFIVAQKHASRIRTVGSLKLKSPKVYFWKTRKASETTGCISEVRSRYVWSCMNVAGSSMIALLITLQKVLKISFSEEVHAVCSHSPLTGQHWGTAVCPHCSAGKKLLLELDAVARERFYVGNIAGIC